MTMYIYIYIYIYRSKRLVGENIRLYMIYIYIVRPCYVSFFLMHLFPKYHKFPNQTAVSL